MKKFQKGVILLPIAIIIIFFFVVGFFFYQSYQSAKQKAQKTQELSNKAIATVTPPPTTENTEAIVTPAVHGSTFKYMNFSISYPESWTFLDRSTNDNFPLKERLSIYESGKVVALNKEGIYLIVAIEEETEGGAGGIFIDDEDYNNFISNRDKVIIGNTMFYLSRTHSAIGVLQESHSGPYEWSSLTEFIPSKSTPSGIYRGYEDIIKRNGYAYNFIVVSENADSTPTKIQNEIISILETIRW
jgi:hypothetical protein